MSRVARQAQHLEQILLERLSQPVDSLSAESPAEDEVSAALETAERLRHGRAAFDLTPEDLVRAQQRLLVRLSSQSQDRHERLRDSLQRWRDLRLGYRLSLQTAWLSLLLTVIFSISQFMAASAHALPGDLLYPFKLAQEQMRLWLAFSPAQNARLHGELAQQRLLEIQALVLENRYEYLPITVARFGRHVARALDSLQQAAQRDPTQAQVLAASLEEVLIGQAGLMPVMANMAPSQNQGEFFQLISITQNGLLGVKEVLKPSGQAPLEMQMVGQPAGQAGPVGKCELNRFARWPVSSNEMFIAAFSTLKGIVETYRLHVIL